MLAIGTFVRGYNINISDCAMMFLEAICIANKL